MWLCSSNWIIVIHFSKGLCQNVKHLWNHHRDLGVGRANGSNIYWNIYSICSNPFWKWFFKSGVGEPFKHRTSQGIWSTRVIYTHIYDICIYLETKIYRPIFGRFNPSNSSSQHTKKGRALGFKANIILLYPRHPKSSKYLLSRCLEPLKAFKTEMFAVQTPTQ